MFAPMRYIPWALRFYGKVPFDLASSGIPFCSADEMRILAERVDPASFVDRSNEEGLSSAIATYVGRPRSEIVPALGTTHALFLAYAAMLSPGDEILVEDPGYEPLFRVAEGLGASARTFPRREADRFAVDPEIVAARMGPKTRAIVVSNLHNPSGVRIPNDVLLDLARIAEARGAYLVVDEVYGAFDDLLDPKSARHVADNVVTVSSLTKCYGLGMHRVGWLLGPPEIALRAQDAALSTFIHLPSTHAAFGIAAFAQLSHFAERARAIVGEKRRVAERWIGSFPEARWSAPAAGLFGLVSLPGREDLLPSIERLAETAGVLVGAGRFFGAPHAFRLSWASCDEGRFEEGLARLAPLVRGEL